MSSGPGLSDAIPNRYAGPQVNLVPIQVFPREPLGTDRKYPIGQVVIIGKDPSTGTQGDLWYLAKFAAGVADWRILAASGGSVTDLRDQVDTLVTPTNDGYIDIDGAVVANGANPSSIPLETVGSTNTLTVQLQVATERTGAPANKNDAGICSFDDTAFVVDANGYVTLAGGAGPAIDSVNVDFNTAPGTDPVVPTGAGVVSIAGATVANATNASAPVATHSRAANAFNVEVQVGADRTGAPADKNDAGLVSFNDTQFVTDANGYTSLVGGANLPGIQTLTSDDPTVVGPDGSGNITCTGEAVANATNAKPLFVDAGANALNWEIQVATERTGAPADKNDAGICSFDDGDFTVDANGFVQLAGGGAAQTITGDSGGALSPTAGNWNILGGAGITTSGSGSTLTIAFSGSEVPQVGVRNLGIKYSGGTFSICAADGTDLSGSNVGYVTMASAQTPGELVTVALTDNQSFVDDTGTSTVAGMLWGTTTAVDWSSDMPFFIYAIIKDDDSDIAFGITRSPAMSISYAAANIGVRGAVVTTNQNSLFLLDKTTGPTSPTVGDYDANPGLRVGSFRMTKTSGASNDWTVSALSDEDGIGRFQWGTYWVMPSGVNGSASGTYFQSNAGTEPVFSSSVVNYSLNESGTVFCAHEHNTATAGVGAQGLQPTLPCTGLNANDAYNDSLHIVDASSTYNAYTGTINANQSYVLQLILVNATSASLLTNATIANNDSFSLHAWYKGFN